MDKLSEIGQVIEVLMGFGFWNPYANFEKSSKELNWGSPAIDDGSVNQLITTEDGNQVTIEMNTMTQMDSNNQPDGSEDSISYSSDTYLITKDLEWPIHDFFLWAVLSGRLQIAEYLLRIVKHPIAAAMIARHLLLKLSDVANTLGETEDCKNMEMKAG